MEINRFISKRSIVSRVQFAYILIIILICTGFIFSIYQSSITSTRYDHYTNINIKISELSVEFSNSWGFFDMYIKSKDDLYVSKYNEANSKIYKTMKEIEPYIDVDKTSGVYLRGLNNMFDYFRIESYNLMSEVMNSKKLNTKSYDKLTELKTLFNYTNKHAELLVVSYLNYSSDVYTKTVKKYKTAAAQIYFVIIIIILISFIFSMLVSRDLSKTIGKLRQYAELLSNAKWEIPDLKDQKYEELNSLAKAFNKMKNSIRVFIDELKEKAEIENNYHIEMRKSAEKDKLIKETQLLALQSQMNPHFLFNTLNTISRSAMFECAHQTVKLIEATSKILRYNLDYKDKLVKLKEEIRMTEAYVIIQETRFQDQMSFAFDVDKRLEDMYVPPMLIQPLVENAIVHGLGDKVSGGVINIHVKETNNCISISVKDNGIGIDNNRINILLNDKNNETNGLGVFNVKKRLELYYGRDDLMHIESKLSEGTKVTIYIPIEG